jgi:spore germination protein GerM
MSRHGPVRRSWLVVLALLVLGSVGCGIPTDDGPRAISRENVPDEVVDATTEATPAQETVAAQIYLVQSPDDPRLVPVERRVPVENGSVNPQPAAALETLLEATADPTERADGITNLIPQGTRLASQPELVAGTLVVDLTRAIFDVEGENQRAAFGQIVCTADELEGVDAVRFQVAGRPTDAQADSATDEPVTCAGDYQRLLAE